MQMNLPQIHAIFEELLHLTNQILLNFATGSIDSIFGHDDCWQPTG
jgi:hypothetical protein